MQLALQHGYSAWWQTEGVVEILQEAYKKALPSQGNARGLRKIQETLGLPGGPISDDEDARSTGAYGMWYQIKDVLNRSADI
ncbi:hypothetical protein OHC33_004339 [Knufia fluminis]|uniref:Uncharacterized protein n=2 Tax=Knufia TaxID=430999 RepID=A0AAN8I4W0_9EURO|nr:hypothetical protein OHC33_004339 [Knufia fluminis]